MRLLPSVRCWLVLVPLALLASPTLAHEGFPDTTSVTVRRDHPEDIIVGATFGAVVSRDSGKTWRWICPEAMLYGGWRPETYLWQPDGDLLAATGASLLRSRDGGCTWQVHPFFSSRGLWAMSLASPDSQPSRVWVVTSRATGSSPNGLYRSDDGGETFTVTSLRHADAQFTAVKVAPSDTRRIYVSNSLPSGPRIHRSDDEGATWEEIRPTLPIFERPPYDLFVLQVSDKDPDHLWARVTAVQESAPPGAYTYVLESTDGGRTFRSTFKLDEYLIGIEASADGRTVWAATPTRLYRSRDGEPAALLPLPDGNACVKREGDVLFVCGADRTHDWVLARTRDEGDTYEPLFALPNIQGPTCPAGTPTRDVCRPRWPQFAPSIGADPALPPEEPGRTDAGTPDAGSPDAGSSGGTEPPPRTHGCSTTGVLMPAACLLALATFRHFRRQHPKT